MRVPAVCSLIAISLILAAAPLAARAADCADLSKTGLRDTTLTIARLCPREDSCLRTAGPSTNFPRSAVSQA